MKARKLGRILSAIVGAAFIASTLAPSAAAGWTSTSVLNVSGCYRNTLGLCAWTSTSNFFALWSARVEYSEGHYYWYVTNLQMDVVVANGKNCMVGPNNCTNWDLVATATFLNSSGATVASYYIDSLITENLLSCYDVAYNPSSIYLYGCRTATEVPYSATKVRFNWSVSMKCGTCNTQTPWTATKTVTLAST